MTSTTRRLLVALMLPVLILTACSSQSQQGWQKAGKGFVNLLLSPIMIAAGIAEGIAFLPYTADADVKELDRALVQAKAVSLNESYKATFGIPLTHPSWSATSHTPGPGASSSWPWCTGIRARSRSRSARRARTSWPRCGPGTIRPGTKPTCAT